MSSQGPSSALALAIAGARPALLRIARHYDQRDPEDLLQDAVLNALSYGRHYRGASIVAYMRTVIARTAADRYRRDCVQLTLGNLVSHADEPLCVADLVARDESLQIAMDAAGCEASEWFALLADGYTYREIANRYGVPTCRVRSRLARARKRAREARADELTCGEV